MSWELFFLFCFAAGLIFIVVSFFVGILHLHFHLHLPKSFHFGGMHHAGFPVVNPMTMAAFLTWFGGAGYLLAHFRHLWILPVLAFATLAGMAGALTVFGFVAKVLMAHERNLDPLDYEMVGVLGHVSSRIREPGGTGEIIFCQEGVRGTCAARSDTGEALFKGEEVFVTRYEHGIAYVRRWEDLTNST